MSVRKKDDDLVNNPFVALFPNIEHAKQYVEATRVGLEQSKKLIPQVPVETTEDKKTKREDSVSSKHIKKSILQAKDMIINDYLQRIFLVTVNCDEENKGATHLGGLPARCLKLDELSKELSDAKAPLFLTVENLNQALLERLQMTDTVIHLCIQSGSREKALDAVMDAREELLVNYLSACYARLNTEENHLTRKIAKDKSFLEEITDISNKCRKLILSFTGSILLQPEIFPTNNPHHQLFSVLTSSSSEPFLLEYVQKLVESYTDPDDLRTMFAPVLNLIAQKANQLVLFNPEVIALLDALIFFSKDVTLTWMVLKSKYWLPPALQPGGNVRYIKGSSFEQETILGWFLRLSSLPKDFNASVPEHFLEPSRQSEAEMNAITENIRRQIDIIVNKVHELVYNLVQKPEAQHEVLYWFGICLSTNTARFQMMYDPTTNCNCGFFLNLTHLLLKFCQPFLSPSSKLLLKVDCRYGAASATRESISKLDTPLHSVGLDKLTPMIPKPDHIPPILANNIKFKFVSEMFFLTQLCYKLGYMKTYEKYQDVMKRLQKLSNLFQETRMQGGEDSMVESMKNDFENGIRRQLAIKAHLISPNLSDLSTKFCVASSYWLTQQTLAGKDYSISKHRELKAKYLTNEVAAALTVVPEFIPENIGDTVRMLGYFNEDALERCEDLHHIMEFFAVFLGDSSRVKNPHLRAKLAECLAAFLPKDRSNQSNLFSFSFRKKAFEQSSVVPKILPKSLLQLFVDIEFTGHAMEFDQKFTYRHYMYEILEYIWNIPTYHATFRKLYEEGKVVYKRDLNFSAFPRFINLLVNDSTFLLDEALQNLVMIKTLQEEEASGQWNNLSQDDKKQKEQNLVQFGHFARAYNTMANETVHVLCYITSDIQKPFASPCMADSMAAFLNYFYVHLVGPKRKDLKVNNFKKFNFNPASLVKNITLIYVSLGKEEEFLRAIVKDTRSYSDEIFSRAIDLVERLEGCQFLQNDLRKLAKKLHHLHKVFRKSEEEMPEPPDEFLDPISCMLMYEPVKLPSSGKILCKSTIAKHLLSDEKDPFNRSPLRLDQVEPCSELQERIRKWMTDNNVQPPAYTAEDCGG
ncbi:ubiquitin conjugation factor E4 A-like [Hydractinia symbiolongicarpus]|uniref:ubiquitin conjugation factor E4 A-like n=1 Tax=Hydractinia symbiolongicarpus TaxID=13093 RepID=UPI00254BFD27|nr:ubiquitin conjugation factor E4 A-like [Hydractinia symbiolongicarpus]